MARPTRKKPARKPARRRPDALTERLQETAKGRGMSDAAAGASSAGRRLRALLEDPFLPVRQSAAFALAVVRDENLVHQFIASLSGASSKEIARAATALGEAGYQNAAPYLIAAFADADKVLAAALAHALGLLGDKTAVPPLVSALDRDFVPAEAAEALGRLDAFEAIPNLLRALAHRDDKVRAAAAYALGIIRQETPDGEAGCRTALHGLSEDPKPRVRLCAAVALIERGDERGVMAVKAALQ
jgi:HEAT repeat protein